MDKRKLAFAAGGASIVAAALAMNVGAASAAPCENVVSCDGGGGGDLFTPLQKITSVIQKLSVLDKASPAISNLDSVLSKLEAVFIKFD